MSRKGESIFKRKDGRFEGRYIKKYVDNKAIYGYVYAKTYNECKNDDWLTPASWSWSLSPRAASSDSRIVFSVYPSGYVYGYNAVNAGSVRPTVYLKSDVKIVGGNGSSETPFQLYYEES